MHESCYYLTNLPLSLGVSLRNLGPGIKYINQSTKLPLSASFGAAYHVVTGLALGIDVKQQIYNKRTDFSFGTEYMILPIFTLRGGYLLNGSSQLMNGLGAGFGMRILGYRLDYAITPFGELGNTHRVSLTTRF